MNGHFISVKVRVEGSANQGMNLDRLSFNQNRLESLDAQAVEGRRTIQQHRVFPDYLLQDVPHKGILLFHHFLRRLDGRAMSCLLEAVVDERFEKLEGHSLG